MVIWNIDGGLIWAKWDSPGVQPRGGTATLHFYTFIESCSKHIYRLLNVKSHEKITLPLPPTWKREPLLWNALSWNKKKKHTLPKPGKSGRMVILPFHLPSYIEKKTYDEIIELSLMSTVNFRDFISIEDIIIIAVAMFPEFKLVGAMCLSKCHLLVLLSNYK